MFVLGLGAVSWAWSEVGFWAQFRSEDGVGGWVLTWLTYSLAAGVAARALARFPARTAAAVVVAGAFYGWLVEGAVAATLYTSLPFSLVWTGVAWHAVLTVWGGWWALPRALRRGGGVAAASCAVLGVAWGLWSVAWWGGPPHPRRGRASPARGGGGGGGDCGGARGGAPHQIPVRCRHRRRWGPTRCS